MLLAKMTWFIATALAVCGSFAQARAQAATEPSPILVELFTSEGCSSCPPADALLAKVNGRWTDAHQLIVGISEHVTYWNSLGWTDPFSLDSVTERQNHYGNLFLLDSVYTPQIVVNGDTQILGSDPVALQKTLRAQPATTSLTLHILSVSPSAHGWSVTFSVAGEVPQQGVDVYAVIADDTRSTRVPRGENTGRTLAHVSVARRLEKVATIKAPGTTIVTVPHAGVDEGPSHLIVFAQKRGLGRVLSVESRALTQ
jgi:hypothetical protein